MKQIERNLLTSSIIALDDAKYMIELINEQPESKLVEGRKETATKKIAIAQTFLNVLKMITCNHSKGKGDTTGITWHQVFNDNGKKLQSFKEITKRCDNCNQVFYRKRYNLMRKKKNV